MGLSIIYSPAINIFFFVGIFQIGHGSGMIWRFPKLWIPQLDGEEKPRESPSP
jgi:hypothetical protein